MRIHRIGCSLCGSMLNIDRNPRSKKLEIDGGFSIDVSQLAYLRVAADGEAAQISKDPNAFLGDHICFKCITIIKSIPDDPPRLENEEPCHQNSPTDSDDSSSPPRPSSKTHHA